MSPKDILGDLTGAYPNIASQLLRQSTIPQNLVMDGLVAAVAVSTGNILAWNPGATPNDVLKVRPAVEPASGPMALDTSLIMGVALNDAAIDGKVSAITFGPVQVAVKPDASISVGDIIAFSDMAGVGDILQEAVSDDFISTSTESDGDVDGAHNHSVEVGEHEVGSHSHDSGTLSAGSHMVGSHSHGHGTLSAGDHSVGAHSHGSGSLAADDHSLAAHSHNMGATTSAADTIHSHGITAPTPENPSPSSTSTNTHGHSVSGPTSANTNVTLTHGISGSTAQRSSYTLTHEISGSTAQRSSYTLTHSIAGSTGQRDAFTLPHGSTTTEEDTTGHSHKIALEDIIIPKINYLGRAITNKNSDNKVVVFVNPGVT